MNSKILLISYFFPPSRTSAIARVVGFIKNLQDYNCNPVVLTVSEPKDRFSLGKDKNGNLSNNEDLPENVEVHKSIELDITKPVNFFDMLSKKGLKLFGITFKKYYFREMCIPDTQITWFPLLKGIALARRCQVMFVTCSPFSSALSACLIRKISKTPLIVDFRDAWTLNPYQLDHTWIHRKVSSLMENWVIKTCDALILNTEGALKLYQDNYENYRDKMYCIPNGYDRLDLAEPEKSNSKFVIMHVGNFYGTRNPKILFDAIGELEFKDQIEFVQIGGDFVGSKDYQGKINLTITGALKNTEALEKMKTASLLYLKQGRNELDKNYVAVAAKTYEYLATGIPILCDCPEGDNMNIVKNYSSCSYLTAEGDKETLKTLLTKAYKNRKVVPEINKNFIEDFSRKNLTKRLKDVIDKVAG